MKKQPKKLDLRKETLFNLGMTSAELEAARGGSVLTDTTDLDKRRTKPYTTDY